MRKIFSICLLICITILSSNSQVPEKKMKLKNEIFVSYGFGSSQEIASMFEDMFVSILTFANGESKINGLRGPFILGYKRILWDYLGIGILTSYTSYNSEYRRISDNSLVYSKSNKFYTVLAKLDLYYVINEWVQMYSGGSFGIINCKSSLNIVDNSEAEDNDKTVPAFQINAFSLRVGKRFGGYFELGYGSNGMVNLGLSYKF